MQTFLPHLFNTRHKNRSTIFFGTIALLYGYKPQLLESKVAIFSLHRSVGLIRSVTLSLSVFDIVSGDGAGQL